MYIYYICLSMSISNSCSFITCSHEVIRGSLDEYNNVFNYIHVMMLMNVNLLLCKAQLFHFDLMFSFCIIIIII